MAVLLGLCRPIMRIAREVNTPGRFLTVVAVPVVPVMWPVPVMVAVIKMPAVGSVEPPVFVKAGVWPVVKAPMVAEMEAAAEFAVVTAVAAVLPLGNFLHQGLLVGVRPGLLCLHAGQLEPGNEKGGGKPHNDESNGKARAAHENPPRKCGVAISMHNKAFCEKEKITNGKYALKS